MYTVIVVIVIVSLKRVRPFLCLVGLLIYLQSRCEFSLAIVIIVSIHKSNCYKNRNKQSTKSKKFRKRLELFEACIVPTELDRAPQC